MANQGNNVIERIFGWEFIKWVSPTFWQSVGHITSDPLANWYPCSNPPSNPAPSLSLCHFRSPSLFTLSPYVPHVLKMCHASTSGLSEAFMSSFCYQGWQGIPLPLVAGHSVSPGEGTFRCPRWQGKESLGFEAGAHGCCGMCVKERHGHAMGDLALMFVCDNAWMLARVRLCDFCHCVKLQLPEVLFYKYVIIPYRIRLKKFGKNIGWNQKAKEMNAWHPKCVFCERACVPRETRSKGRWGRVALGNREWKGSEGWRRMHFTEESSAAWLCTALNLKLFP